MKTNMKQGQQQNVSNTRIARNSTNNVTVSTRIKQVQRQNVSKTRIARNSANKVTDTTKSRIRAMQKNSYMEPYRPFDELRVAIAKEGNQSLHSNSNSSLVGAANNNSSSISSGVEKTIAVLREMGVITSTHLDADKDLIASLPPWSKVVENFGTEPIVLGLERCEAYRKAVPTNMRKTAPAGLFSTGTNVLDLLLRFNCFLPQNRQLHLWQTPWGKHNPSMARLKHIAGTKEKDVPGSFQSVNQSTVLPIVTIRHPYTWLEALCKHPYTLKWPHSRKNCERKLRLDFSLQGQFGAQNSGVPVPQTYKSLMHVWRDWNADYFQETGYPFLMIRLEDVVFRPKDVVTKICTCVGGRLFRKFTYEQNSANVGKGHGQHRSNLLTAFLKFSQPLEDIRNTMYSPEDWKIIDEVLSDDYGLMDAFYPSVRKTHKEEESYP